MIRVSQLPFGTIALALILSPLAHASAQSAVPAKAGPVFVDGQAQVVPAFEDQSKWIHQELWVEAPFDTDHDGKKDRIHVDVTRPAQTETEGLKVPIIMGSSPYYAGTGRPQVNWDVQVEVGETPPPRGKMNQPPFKSPRPVISNALVNEWVARGFAVVHNDAPGTGLSQGCPTVGDYPEREAPAAVIDWLNGRAKGFTTETGNVEVKATSWSTGKVGMIGTSYEGTLPLAAATTGVKGLEVVVPVSPNTSYYHYYRTNGLVRSPSGYLGEDVDVLYDFIASGDTAMRATCEKIWQHGIFAGPTGQDRASGDMNKFWLDRDLLLHVKDIHAAVLLAHGFNDYNVVSEHSVRIYNEMVAEHKPVSIYLHTGGHGGNPPAAQVNRWFSHYLYGVDNGVEKDPPVWIVQDVGMQAPLAMARAKAYADSVAANPPPAGTVISAPGRGGRGARGGRGGGAAAASTIEVAGFPTGPSLTSLNRMLDSVKAAGGSAAVAIALPGAPTAADSAQLMRLTALLPSAASATFAPPAGRGGGRGGRGGLPTPPTPFASFPIPGSVMVDFHPMAGGNGIGKLSFAAPASGTEKLVDDVAFSGSGNAAAEQSPHRLLYASGVLTDTVHISGTAKVTLRIASSKPAANLSVWLVMLPYDSANVGSGGHAGLISRGWADIRNYKSLTHGGNYESTIPEEQLVPGKFYDLTFDLEPDDEFVSAGKRFALMIMSSDREFTLWPKAGTELTVDLAHSFVSIPIVGGKTAVTKAGGM